MSVNLPSSLYERSLSTLGYGLPLWFPEPETSRGEIQVGDVGFKRPGEFVRIFNTMKPEGDRANLFGVPRNTSPLVVRAHQWHERPDFLHPGPICSKAVRAKSAHADLSA